MEMKRATARNAKGEARASTKSVRPSTTQEAAPKKREKSDAPPALHVANDNDHEKEPKKAAPTPIGRGRLPTGSLHTEARIPAEAELIKQRLTALVNVQQKLGELKRSSNKNFYEIGGLLLRVRDERLFEVKGYSTLEAYIEREVNLSQQFCREAIRIVETFLPSAAASLGFARLAAAIRAMEDEPTGVTDIGRMARSHIPPHKL